MAVIHLDTSEVINFKSSDEIPSCPLLVELFLILIMRRVVVLQLTVPKNILLSIYNALILPQINYCLLCWSYDTSEISLLQKKAIQIISGANIKSHTEPIFKLYNLLKIEDFYKSKLLILYYKILKLSSPRYFDTFIPKNSAGVSRYPIRNPRWQPPAHRHTYITSTSRYQLAVLLNSITIHMI